MNLGDPNGTPIPPKPASRQAKPAMQSGDIRLPQLEKKEAQDEAAKIAQQQQQNPQTPDKDGLNSSGLPSSEAYYKKKNTPVHTSAITPIVESRVWIRIIALATIVFSLFWIKGAVDGLRFQSGILPAILHFIELILSFFFFILPAYKLWVLTAEINQLQVERDESTLGSVLYAHAQIWKYVGMVATGALIFMTISLILKISSGLVSI